jgi:predicted DNA-binding mobile mystery protein A
MAISQLDRAVSEISRLPPDLGVKAGWISAVRQAIGMTAEQLANRIGIDPTGVTRYQAREVAGTISLESLRKAANAMDCDLVHAFVPRGGSFEGIVTKRARAVAEAELARATQTMALEDQPVRGAERERQLLERVRHLRESLSSQLWNDDIKTEPDDQGP